MTYSTWSICSFLSVFIQIWCLCQKVTEVLLLLITIISIEDHTGALLLIDWGNRSRVQVPIFRPERITGVPNLPLYNTFQFTCIWNSKSTQVLRLRLPLYQVLRYIFFCFCSFCCFYASFQGYLFCAVSHCPLLSVHSGKLRRNGSKTTAGLLKKQSKRHCISWTVAPLLIVITLNDATALS